MKEHQIMHELELGKQQGKEFIKWWRKENDFVDFELIDRFVERIEADYEIDNFELLDKDEMWKVLERWEPTGLQRRQTTKGDNIEWQHRGKDGERHSVTSPYNAQSIMSIFDEVTRGNTID